MANLSIDIPQDIITDILLRLPVKSLLRYKSVCRSWLSISNPRFIKSHLHNGIMASRNIPKLVNILDPVQYLELQDFSITCPMHMDRILELPRLFYETLYQPQVVGCCNGIICLQDMYGTAGYLWNPSIRQYRKLVIPAKDQLTSVSTCKFCYDSIGDDYKILRIQYGRYFDQYDGLFNYQVPRVPTVQVYSANANSWRKIQSPILQHWMVTTVISVVVNGVLYSGYSVYSGYSQGLISFDLHTEVLGLVPFPNVIKGQFSDVLNFEDSVAVLFECLDDDLLYLWTLDDVSGQMTWVKRNSIKGNLGSNLWLSCYLGAGLFWGIKPINQCDYNVLYDYEKKVIELCGPLPLITGLTLKYTESLVALDGFQQVE